MELNKPAIDGGIPIRDTPLPYARHWLEEREIQAALDVLRSGWITSGPKVQEFEKALCEYTGAAHAVAVNSCTSALHLALNVLEIGPGHEVITTSLTFAATVFAILHNGARPVFADIDENTLNLSPESVEKMITPRTRAILPVHYGGCPCDMDALNRIAHDNGLSVVADAAHAIGAKYQSRHASDFADLSCLSFHAVKNMTTAEGGAVLSNQADLAARLRARRFFGIVSDAWARAATSKPWEYDVSDNGFKCNMTDIQASIGLVQLEKLDGFTARRREIVETYNEAFNDIDSLILTQQTPDADSAHHLYVIRIRPEMLTVDRDHLLAALRAEGITANLHYKPVHLHTYFMKELGTGPGLLPACEAAANTLITLPLFPAMTDRDTQDVIEAVKKLTAWFRK